jgi:hypothetical protein
MTGSYDDMSHRESRDVSEGEARNLLPGQGAGEEVSRYAGSCGYRFRPPLNRSTPGVPQAGLRATVARGDRSSQRPGVNRVEPHRGDVRNPAALDSSSVEVLMRPKQYKPERMHELTLRVAPPSRVQIRDPVAISPVTGAYVYRTRVRFERGYAQGVWRSGGIRGRGNRNHFAFALQK